LKLSARKVQDEQKETAAIVADYQRDPATLDPAVHVHLDSSPGTLAK